LLFSSLGVSLTRSFMLFPTPIKQNPHFTVLRDDSVLHKEKAPADRATYAGAKVAAEEKPLSGSEASFADAPGPRCDRPHTAGDLP
jgi:hypothetical protein